MIHLIWNCHGLRLDTVVQALHGLIRKYRPSVVLLSETKMKNQKIIGVRMRMGFANGCDVPLVGSAGGLSLWWDDSLKVKVMSSNRNLIHTEMRISGDEWFQASWIYGTPYRNEKNDFWHWIMQELSPSEVSWFCAGDFNEILSEDEKFGGN